MYVCLFVCAVVSGAKLKLNKGWSAVQPGSRKIGLDLNARYRAPSYTLNGKVCFLSGMVIRDRALPSKAHRVVAKLPFLCRPERRLAFAVSHNTAIVRFDVGH